MTSTVIAAGGASAIAPQLACPSVIRSGGAPTQELRRCASLRCDGNDRADRPTHGFAPANCGNDAEEACQGVYARSKGRPRLPPATGLGPLY